MRFAMRRRNQRGSAIVESGLILTVFLTMLIGIVDFGQFLFVHQTLVERARGGMRWGVVRAFNEQSIKNVILYNNPAGGGGNDGTPARPPLFGLSTSNLVVQQVGANSERRLRVVVTGYRIPVLSPWIARTLNGRDIVMTAPYEYIAP